MKNANIQRKQVKTANQNNRRNITYNDSPENRQKNHIFTMKL